MRNLKKSFISLALAGVAIASQAATVHVKFDNPIFNGTAFDQLTIKFALPATPPATSTQTVQAGLFWGTASNPVGVNPSIFVDNSSDLLMYCYDIYEHINHGQDVDYSLSFFGATARTLDFLGAVNSVLSTTSDPFAWLHPVDGNQGAAIQLGIWESLYDTDWNIGDGNFKVMAGMNPATEIALTSFLDAIPGSNALDQSFTMVLEARGAQDMITGRKPQFEPATDIPEPGSLALIALGLIGLAASRRLHKPA